MQEIRFDFADTPPPWSKIEKFKVCKKSRSRLDVSVIAYHFRNENLDTSEEFSRSTFYYIETRVLNHY